MDANKAYGEWVGQQLHKNASSCIKQFVETIPKKTAAVRPPTTRHEIYLKLDEQNMRDTFGEVKTKSWAMYFCGPLHIE